MGFYSPVKKAPVLQATESRRVEGRQPPLCTDIVRYFGLTFNSGILGFWVVGFWGFGGWGFGELFAGGWFSGCLKSLFYIGVLLFPLKVLIYRFSCFCMRVAKKLQN